MSEPDYLGDGVYATFDGYYIRLSTQRGMDEHVIYLDPPVMDALGSYAAAAYGQASEATP